jgi:ubiquinone/menaquinone biosynthesis C-methylase UbiE
MSQSERWHLGGNAPEVYQRELVPAIFEPWASLLVAKAALCESERVLDVACGTGVVARLAAAHVGAKGHVVGLDLNPGMLACASSSTESAAVEWRQGDAVALPFDARSFDAVFCQLGFQYFSDRQQAAREMYRVLKPGGRVVALVWRALAHSPGFAAIAAALERHVSPAAAALMRAPFVFGDTINELRELFVQTGFRMVRVSADVRMVRFASPAALVRHQVASSPLAPHVAEVDDTAHDALVREVTGAMQSYVNDDGLAFPIEGHIALAHP